MPTTDGGTEVVPAQRGGGNGERLVATAVSLTKAIDATEAVEWAHVPTVAACEAAAWVERLDEARDTLDVAAVSHLAVKEELSHHQAEVLAVVREYDEIPMNTLYRVYGRRVGSPMSRRTVRKYLNHLDDLGLVEARGEKRGRTYAPEKQ